MNISGVAALVIFSISYFFIATEKVNKTIVAILGATTMIFFGLFEETEKVWATYIDFNTIFLLLGMMTFVSVLEESGLFQYIGIKVAQHSGASSKKLFIMLTLFVAIMSGFLDNVTTILVAMPLTFAITEPLQMDPIPFVIGEIFASNIGGTMTLIGDPPNIMIGSEAHLDFVQFLLNTGPVAIIMLFLSDLALILFFRNAFSKKIDKKVIDSLDPKSSISNPRDFKLSIVFFIATVTMFLLQTVTHIENSAIAMAAGFTSMLFMERKKVDYILKKVDWSTLTFFLGLFVMVGALGNTGVLNELAKIMILLSRNSYVLMEAIIISFSAVLSSIIDNVPLTATLIPVIKSMRSLDPKIYANLNPLWWSLSLGACLGGNGTVVGASANVVALALLKRSYKKEISFAKFLKYGVVVLGLSIVISTLYVFVRYGKG